MSYSPSPLLPIDTRAARRAADRRAIRRRRARRRMAGLVMAGLASIGLLALAASSSGGGGNVPDAAARPADGGAPASPQSPDTGTSPSVDTGAARAKARRERRRRSDPIERVLAYTPFVAGGSPRKREVALTFDDGPGPYTRAIVRILRRERAEATFFVVGEQVADFATSMLSAAAAGFPVGDHTQTHARLAGMKPPAQRRQLEDQQAVVKGAGVPVARLFRPPFGVYDAATLRLLRRKRMLMVLWSVDTNDYTRPGVRAIVRAALRGAKPGAIILLHDGGGDRSQTVSALPRILQGLRKRRLRPVTIPRLIADDPPPRQQGRPQGLIGG